MAAGRGRRVLLSLAGDPGDAKRAIREVRGELQRMSRQEARVRIDIQTARAQRQLDAVNRQIAKYRAQKPSAEAELKITKALERAALIELRLDKLARKRVTIDVDVKRGALERAASGLGTVERGVQGVSKGFANVFRQVPIVGGLLESVFSGAFSLAQSLGTAVAEIATKGLSSLLGGLGSLGVLAGPIGAVGGQVASLAVSLLSMGLVAGGIVIALNALLGAIVALGGALVALVASAAAAAAGLGALAIGFGAALIPVALVAIGVFQRFAAILKAHQAQQQQLAQATQDAKTAEQAHTAALEERKRAEEQLANATVAGREAMARATQDETDAELGLRNARNGVEDARLQLAIAKRDLRAFLKEAGQAGPQLDSLFKRATDTASSPEQLRKLVGHVTSGNKGVDPLDLRQKIQAVRDAQLGVANATNQVTHSERDLAEARRKEADFTQRGIRAYAPYRAALLAVDRANARVARTLDQTSAAQRKYQTALKELSSTEQGTLSRGSKLIEGLKGIAKAMTDPIFRAFNVVMDSFSGSGQFFEGVLRQVGQAIAGVVIALARFVAEPATLAAFRTMATGAAQLVRELGAHAFISFLHIMREIAVTALPAVEAAAKGVAGWLAHIAGQPGRIHSVVGTLVAQFQTWARFAGAVARLVLALFSNAAPAGRSLVVSLTRIVNRWTAWLNANPGAVRRFFNDAIAKTKSIVSWIKSAVTWVGTHLPAAAAKAEKAFKTLAHIVDQIPIIGKNKLEHTADNAAALIKSISADSAKLKTHISAGERASTRQDLADNLRQLAKLGPLTGSLSNLLGRLKSLGFARGGVVPGSGRGDIVPAFLEPGEFVLRRNVVSALGTGVLHALNGGGVPQVAMAGGPARASGDVHNHFHIPQPLDATKPIDPANTATLLQREWEARGGGLG